MTDPSMDSRKATEGSTGAEPAKGFDYIRGRLRLLPRSPGVYRMLNSKGDVLYVGKAKNLRNRVSNYGNRNGLANRIARMVSQTTDLVIVTTRTESEALLLEAQLIKKFKPPFNVLLRDDKSFPYIFMGGEHDFPQLAKHRGARRRKGSYFGPFASAGAVNQTLNTLQRAFLLRTCSDNVFDSRSRPCLLFQIKRCSAPCVDRISKNDYAQLVEDARDFLLGRSQRIQKQLSSQMQTASDAREFERAAALRDRIQALTTIQARQAISPPDLDEADVFALAQEAGQTCIQVFFIRAGQSWGNRAYFPRHESDVETGEILSSFIAQFYDNKLPPERVLTSLPVPEKVLLADALSIKAGYKVKVEQPQRGPNKRLMELAEQNARDALRLRLAENASQQKILQELADLFDLDGPPKRIEAYDNSHISGSHALGAMVVITPEGFQKNAYRKFNIKDQDLAPGDDYAMMREVLRRRFERQVRENPDREDPSWPDLLLIDGGAGQLTAARDVLADLGLDHVPVVGIAKGPDRNAGRERFFMPDRKPFMLPPDNAVLYYLQRVRDEVHRFAIGSHRARRSKAVGKSLLDDVPGIGPKRKKALLNHFGSAKAVTDATVDDLTTVDGISRHTAQIIHDHFHTD